MLRHLAYQQRIRQLQRIVEKVKKNNNYDAVPGKLGLLNNMIKYPQKNLIRYEKYMTPDKNRNKKLCTVREEDIEEYIEYVIILQQGAS